MNTLNKNKYAFIITAAMIFAAFIIGGIRPLNAMREGVLAVFYADETQIGPDIVNVGSEIRDYAGYVVNIPVKAQKYEGYAALCDSLRESRDMLLWALETGDFDELGLMLQRVREQALDISGKLLDDPGVSDEDKQLIQRNRANMSSVYDRIVRQTSHFNERAASYNGKLSAVPAVFFKITGLVKPLELFYN